MTNYNTAAAPTRPLTDAEVERLNRLYNRVEDARNFTASSKALDALNAYEHRLMRSGASIDAILQARGTPTPERTPEMTNYQSYEEAIKAGAKGTDTITEPCDRCSGNGDIGYGKVKVYDVRVGVGVAQTCWKCFGRKTQTVRVSSVKARIRRAEKLAQKLAQEQAEAEAAKIARAEWNATNPAVASLINELADRDREQGLAYELLVGHAIPTDAQIAKLHEIKAQREEREAARRPVVTGKAVQIEGEVISAKAHETHFGYRTQYTTKIVVRDDRGFKVWGTLPNELAAELHLAFLDAKEAEGYSKYDFGPDCWLESAKGRRIRFTANIEASDRDDSFDFGFFKLPRKAELV